MGKMIYTAITSLDGFVEDEHGKFDWAEPNEEVHTYINQLEDRNETLILGRKLYETMAVWEAEESFKDLPMYIKEYGRIWRKAEKIVYSRTLLEAAGAKTIIRPNFDPDEVKRMKETGKGDIGIGGSELAGVALSHDLVDEVHLFIHPIVVGNGKPAIARGFRRRMSLKETKCFEGGVVLLQYRL